MAEKTIFDFLNSINLKTGILPYDKKSAPAFLLSMWLSHDKSLIDYVDNINRFQFSLPDEVIYKYYYNIIPKGKRFLKWVKKDVVEDKKEKEKLDNIRKEMLLSKREMEHFREFIPLLDEPKTKKKKVENASKLFL